MEREVIQFASEAEWLAARTKDITSTEVAGLFNAGSYEGSRTMFELFQIKSGAIPKPEFVVSDRVKWGSRMEATIAHGIAEDYGVIVRPMKEYIRIPSMRLAASFDFRIIGLVEGFTGDEKLREMFRQHGDGILEIKAVDSLQFKRGWIEDGEEIEATAQIEMQVACQMEVADLEWAVIAALVGGNTPKIIIRKRDREVGDAIKAKAVEFWGRIATNHPPEPNFETDAKLIAALNTNSNGQELDMTDNNRLAELCAERKRASDDEAAAKKRKDAATAEILTIIGEASKVRAAGGFTISAGTVGESFVEGYTRKAYRNVRLTHKAA